MFKQLKSALFWYYLIKFRKRITLIILLLVIALFSNAIYSDVIEYLTLKEKLEYFEIVLISKWFIIIFNIVLSVYLFLTIFKKEETDIKVKTKKETKKTKKDEDKFSKREQEFLYKKKIRNKADVLLDK